MKRIEIDGVSMAVVEPVMTYTVDYESSRTRMAVWSAADGGQVGKATDRRRAVKELLKKLGINELASSDFIVRADFSQLAPLLAGAVMAAVQSEAIAVDERRDSAKRSEQMEKENRVTFALHMKEHGWSGDQITEQVRIHDTFVEVYGSFDGAFKTTTYRIRKSGSINWKLVAQKVADLLDYRARKQTEEVQKEHARAATRKFAVGLGLAKFIPNDFNGELVYRMSPGAIIDSWGAMSLVVKFSRETIEAQPEKIREAVETLLAAGLLRKPRG